jgi:IS30 family transposase
MQTAPPTTLGHSMPERQRNIEHLRSELGLSLAAIAKRYGVSRTTIANWRRGRSRTSYTCWDCGNPMIRQAIRCGMCIEEAEQQTQDSTAVAA